MKVNQTVPLDAEKVSNDILRKCYLSPPGFEKLANKSTLLVGGRGSGKTMFLRALRHTNKGISVFGDLRLILNSISIDIGAGGLMFSRISPGEEPAIQGKTAAILSWWLATALKKKGISPSLSLLRKILPRSLKNFLSDGDALSERMGNLFYDSEITEYRSDSILSFFIEFVLDLAHKCQKAEGPLLILLDRAQDIPYPCLEPIYALLEHGNHFITVVATKPGIFWPHKSDPSDCSPSSIKFEVRHLGASPYSSSWRAYLNTVIDTWLPHSVDRVPSIHLEELLSIARDSIRVALDLAHNSINRKGAFDHSKFIESIANLRGPLVSGSQSLLRDFNDDINSYLFKLRRSLWDFRLPVNIEIKSSDRDHHLAQPKPMKEMSRDELFVNIGLRTGLFKTINGVSWHPLICLDTVEVNPLALWRDGDKWYDGAYATINISPGDLTGKKHNERAQAVLSGYQFEREVAAIYRTLGAHVEVDVGLAGSQIDIVLKERTQSGSEIIAAIECKSSERPVGINVIISFASITNLLKQRGLIDRAVLVSRAGFTAQARQAASEYSIELLVFDDLIQRVEGKHKTVETAENQLEKEQSSKAALNRKRIFVAMPFAKEFDDIYLLGIREVAEKLSFIVERADDVEHNEDILEIIRYKIRSADAIIGDTTGSNPNVFYEIGYAHALKIPTVLIAKRGTQLPFDISSMNHIMYETIVELRERLEKRLRNTLAKELRQELDIA